MRDDPHTEPHGELRSRRLGTVLVDATLLVGPRPAALLLRRPFAAGGRATAAGLAGHAPPAAEVDALLDER
jgi:hypothetical protein